MRWISGLLLVALICAGAYADPPKDPPVLLPGTLVHDGEKALSPGHTASVEVLDWDADGKKDLLVGTFAGGKTLIFLNRGTDALPRFDGGEAVQAGGEILSVGSG